MIISEVIDVLKTELALQRTPAGRPITEYASEIINSSIEDEKNGGANVIKCLNCGIIISSLLAPDGCPNCNGKDLTLDIKEI